MIKMVLVDMDETLLVDFRVPDVNKQAIAKAREKGAHVIPATGRSFDMIQDILKDMGTQYQKNEYSICFNGGAVYENDQEEPIHYQALSYEQVTSLYAICKQYGLCFLAFALDKIYIYDPSESEVARKTKQKANFSVESNLALLEDKKVIKVALQADEEELLYQIGEEQAEVLKKMQVEVSYSSGRFLECTAVGVSKGTALIWLREHLQIMRDETMAIGDNFNDLTMIQEAGVGVCVGDGRKEVQDVSDFVTKRGFKEGAVAEALQKYLG